MFISRFTLAAASLFALTACGSTPPTSDASLTDAAPDATDHVVPTADSAMDTISPSCAVGHGGCDSLVSCTDTEGGVVCGDCPAGYSGTGATACAWNDASLTALVPSGGTLTPAFAPATMTYTIDVGLEVSTLSLRPTVAMPGGATIRVDGTVVASGVDSTPRTLALGDTSFAVVVTAAGGATRSYAVTVHRAAQLLQQAYAKASNTGSGDWFGRAVAISGDTMVVGANLESSNATGVNGDQANNSASHSGAAYVFVRTGTTWTQQAYLKASNTGADDGFGETVAISGDTIVVGAAGEDSNATGVDGNQANDTASSSGAVYVFTRTGTTWTQQAYLKASNAGANDAFGTSLSISGNTIVVGAPGESSRATGVGGVQTDNSAARSGAAYVFVYAGGVWTQQAYLKASNTDAGDSFGLGASISGDTIVVGADAESSSATGVDGDATNNAAIGSGAAYVFVRTGTTWTQQAYLKARNTDAYDNFGQRVAIAGDTIAVSALGEGSNATGIDGDGTNNDARGSGAVYVFVRSGTSWAQQAYLKASNSTAMLRFGDDIAVAGDTIVVGHLQERSRATGVDGDQTDTSAPESGAAYVFVRSGTTWMQQAYLKASNTDAGDWFGFAVAASDDTILVSALQESSSATGLDGNQADNSARRSGAVYTFVRTSSH